MPDRCLRPLKRWHYQRVLGSPSDDDEPDLLVVRHLVEAGSLTVDIGANIGLYTRVLSGLVGPSGSVLAIEPVPETFSILSGNVGALGLSNVALVNAAISDAVGKVRMAIPDYSSGGRNYYQAHIVGEPGASLAKHSGSRIVDVQTMTLDEIVSHRSARAQFVKCDVEGHELSCLRGAKRVLEDHRPAWLIEVAGDPDAAGTSAHSVFNLFDRLGYSAWFVEGRKLVRRSPGLRATNFFFLAENHLGRLQERAAFLFNE